MELRFTTRASDSAWIDTVWTCTSDRVDEMTSVATPCWGLVFWQRDGRSHAAVSGPETATGTLVDSGAELPDVSRRTFRLDGGRWPTPGPDDAEALVDRLVRAGAVVRDPLVTETLRGGRPPASPRTLERRFRAATGLTRGAVRQIDRARRAAVLLAAGGPPADAVATFGYVDEPHLARALRRYVGRTAGELRAGAGGAIALDPAQRVTS
ncbi:helix-turn-helix domain-containing protein [Micromonospora aurantiaca (nom. illeg.)]